MPIEVAPVMTRVDQPVFVLGERAAAVQLARALGDTPTLCALPANRLLAEMVSATDRCAAVLGPLSGVARDGLRPARWYRDVQAAHLRASGKPRTVEYSGVSTLRLCQLFPGAQFVVVRQLQRAMPRSRILPAIERQRILEVDSGTVTLPDTLEHVLAFLGEPADTLELDLSDQPVSNSHNSMTVGTADSQIS
jgi:hypothetical protein